MKKQLLSLLFTSVVLFSACKSTAPVVPLSNASLCPALYDKSIAILGDSYSTFAEWIPDGYSIWYPNPSCNDVLSVQDTWWWKLCQKADCNLLFNSSYSGSTIGYTGYGGYDASATSFVMRAKRDMGKGTVFSAKPDVIFIFGGTNDCWSDAPMGEPQYGDWKEEDLFNSLPALCYLFDYLKRWNPGTKIYFIANTEMKVEFYNGLEIICKRYDVPCIQLYEIGKSGGHPNCAGMESIALQIIDFINAEK